jgi:P27 family predicted phage terminase small subunit
MPDSKSASENLLVSGPGSQAAPPEARLILECPPELGSLAREEWDRVLRELPDAVEIENCDRGPLAIYCVNYERWCEAVEAVRKYGAVIKSANGFPVQSPWLSVLNQAEATMLKIANEFGFTPASRNRFPRWRIVDSVDLVDL